MKTIYWNEVDLDRDLSKKYTVSAHNKFQLHTNNQPLELDNLEQTYANLIQVDEEVALEKLPKKKLANKHQPKKSINVVEAREKLKNISLEYHKHPTQNKRIILIVAKRSLDDVYLNAEIDFINGKITDISNQHISKKHHAAWKTIKELSGKNNKPVIRIKGGSIKNSMSNWSNHFKNLLGKEPKLPDNITLPKVKISDVLNINTNVFTISELKVVLKRLKSSKAFGPDNIPAIIWKDYDLLLKLCNFAFIDKNGPEI